MKRFFVGVPALQRQFRNIHHYYFSVCTFSLMKKYQKIKKVRRLHRGKASLQRGLSFYLTLPSVIMSGALGANWFT